MLSHHTLYFITIHLKEKENLEWNNTHTHTHETKRRVHLGCESVLYSSIIPTRWSRVAADTDADAISLLEIGILPIMLRMNDRLSVVWRNMRSFQNVVVFPFPPENTGHVYHTVKVSCVSVCMDVDEEEENENENEYNIQAKIMEATTRRRTLLRGSK